jgi:Carboxypeptidase regulatory-like domain
MKCKTVFVGLLVILCLPSCLRAQTASIGGTVTDPSGAVVPSAKITAVEVSTGATRSAETDESGIYRITNLNPGVYNIRFEHANFNPFLYSEIPLSVDQVLTLDVKLSLGPERQAIRVSTESVPPIDLNDAQIGNLVDSRQIEDLPLILRDPYQLVLLSPGVIQSNSLFSGFSVNGSRERSNNFMLDGADNNDPDLGGFPKGLSSLNPETTQEFRVLTNSYLPEFGRNNGAIIDIVTKRGTNNFHADLYWSLRKIAARTPSSETSSVIRSAVRFKRPRLSFLRMRNSGASAPHFWKRASFPRPPSRTSSPPRAAASSPFREHPLI